MNTDRLSIYLPPVLCTQAKYLSRYSLALASALLVGCYKTYDEIVIPIHSDYIEERFLITEPDTYNFSLAFYCNAYKSNEELFQCYGEVGNGLDDKNSIESHTKIKITQSGNTVLEKTYTNKGSEGKAGIELYGLDYFSKFRFLGVVPLEKGEYTIRYENLLHDSPLKRHKRFLVIHYKGKKP